MFRRFSSTFYKKWEQPTGFDTGIKIYNCVAREKVRLIIKNKNSLTWYSCGPTVYDSSHIGHASCYVKLDIIQRVLKNHFNLNLVTAMNITDIDDKIIKKSWEEKIDWKLISKKYENEFWEDLRQLGVTAPDLKVRVTENISEIVNFIENLVNSGIAYPAKDGSVYFNVESYKNYGKLQRLVLEDLKHEIKNSILDFALWKSAKEGEPSWDSPWSKGRPGWHIECSTMASNIFGSQIDIHAGGLDLKFPHHENEEAQSCAHHSINQWVNYWLHTGHLHINGEKDKMSKSLKNTISIQELLSKYSSDAFRISCLLSHYKSSMDFGQEVMITADSVLKKFSSFLTDCKSYTEGTKPRTRFDSNLLFQKIKESEENIDKCLRDDFDTAKSMGLLTELTSYTNRIMNNSDFQENNQSSDDKSAIQTVSNFVSKNLQNFGLNFNQKPVQDEGTSKDITELIDNIVKLRCEIRDEAIASKSKEMFKTCDRLRDILKSNKIEIKDHGKTSSWNFIK